MNCDTDEQTQGLIDSMEKEIMMIKEELLRLTWHMRGGLTYSEIFQFSSKERELINKIIKDNLETTKKSGLPYF